MTPIAERMTRAIQSRDYLRRRAITDGGAPAHKEWLHFAVYGHSVDVLVNFSLVDDVGSRAPRGAELARITCLLKDGSWDGDVELCPSEEVRVMGGSIDLDLGPSHVRFVEGAYHLRVRLRGRPIEIDLVLEPEVFPVETNNVVIDDSPPMNWVVIPRLRASGVVRIAGRVHALVDAPAYHDHNWGSFGWGKNFAWEWGYALPSGGASPYSVAFVRLSDRGRRCALMQGIFLWRGDRKHRLFRDQNVSVRYEGLLRPTSVFKLPRVASLVHPGTATDVPQALHFSGSEGDDWLHVEFTSEDVAQIVIPNDSDLEMTIINEVMGTSRVTGVVSGERIDIRGRSICEFLGA